MPIGKRLTVVLSVVIIGMTAAFFFRKDASGFRFWNSGPEDPFARPVERRLATATTPGQQAHHVPASATAAISEPRGLAPDGQPTYTKNLNPVGALLPPIEGVVDGEDADEVDIAGARSAALGNAWRHAVADGDTLSKLAARFLGRADAYLEIFELNRDVLASPDLLPIGAVLKIPARRGTDAAAYATSPFAGNLTAPVDMVPVPGRADRGGP
jgi:hypothetical protein